MNVSTAYSSCSRCRALEQRVAELEAQLAGQAAKLVEMAETIKKLTAALDEARRSGKRQAAPFCKKKKTNPKKPGRKKGDAHGEHAHRESIPDVQLDEIYGI